MIQIPLTPDKYQAALKHLMDLRPPDVEFFQLQVGPLPGAIVTPQVSLTFVYDDIGTLDVTISHKSGFAKFASDNTIKAHLEDLLTGV